MVHSLTKTPQYEYYTFFKKFPDKPYAGCAVAKIWSKGTEMPGRIVILEADMLTGDDHREIEAFRNKIHPEFEKVEEEGI